MLYTAYTLTQCNIHIHAYTVIDTWIHTLKHTWTHTHACIHTRTRAYMDTHTLHKEETENCLSSGSQLRQFLQQS